MIDNFNRLITNINRTKRTDKKNEFIIIHYVGATSTAANNAQYFNSAYRGASATYFVDEHSVWQVVEESDNAWHVGGAKVYYNDARNSNSIGIEMCCKWKNNHWIIEPETIENTIELTASIMQRLGWGVDDLNRIQRHFDTTHKVCPEPLVREPIKWQEFLNRLEEKLMADLPEKSFQEKQEKIKEVAVLDDNTMKYLSFYKYGIPLNDKLYQLAVDAEKYRKGLK